MNMKNISAPAESEYVPFYSTYIQKVGGAGPLRELLNQVGRFQSARLLSDQQADCRYAEDKWNVREVLGHIADFERVFAYRLLTIARGDATPLPGFDENAWAKHAAYRSRPIADIVDEIMAVRAATISLIESIDRRRMGNVGMANGALVSVRALCWIIPGHAAHHLNVLRSKYQIEL